MAHLVTIWNESRTTYIAATVDTLDEARQAVRQHFQEFQEPDQALFIFFAEEPGRIVDDGAFQLLANGRQLVALSSPEKWSGQHGGVLNKKKICFVACFLGLFVGAFCGLIVWHKSGQITAQSYVSAGN